MIEGLPAADAPDVHMDEIRLWIVTHAARFKREGRLPEVGERAARDPDVDGLAGHVQAARSNPYSALTQIIVCLFRAVSRNNVERLAAPNLFGEAVEKVKQPDIDLPDVARPVISKNMIDLLESRGEQLPRTAVCFGQGFPGVSIVKGEPFRFG